MHTDEPPYYDDAKDARDEKNRKLGMAVWFLVTTSVFAAICWVLIDDPRPTIGHLAAICITGLMAVFYAMITYVQALNYWEDDLDGLLRTDDLWRF